METCGKRMADAASPTREDASQSTAIANGRKRRDGLNYGKSLISRSLIATKKVLIEKGQDVTFSEEEDEYNNREEYSDDDESMDEEEREVEQKEHSLGDQKVTFKIFIENHDDEFSTPWIQGVCVHCSYKGQVIGQGSGWYVQRDRLRNSFWRDMDEPSQGLSATAFDLFDRYGRLRKELKDHPVRKGSGVWGSELDLNPFFVIEELLVDKQWRRKAIGTKIATYLIEKSRVGSRHAEFSLVAPGWLTRDIASEIRGKTKEEEQEIGARVHDNAVSFWRSLGFRRIGASDHFGLAKSPNHPARAILPTDDFDPAAEDPEVDEDPEQESYADCDVLDENWKSSLLKLLKDRLPLHHAALTLRDSKCVEFFRAWKKGENSADEWTKLGRRSNNVLHISTWEFKAQTVRWLIDDSGEGQALSLARNMEGYTPLEELESNLETKRTGRDRGMMALGTSDNFHGFPPEAISCLAALRGLGNPSPVQYAQLKFGCTCGLCIDGFLSPRMKLALLCQAEITYDILNEDVEDGKRWLTWHDHLIAHVAPEIQRNLGTNMSYRQGFANIFYQAATTLRDNKSPTVLNVLDTGMSTGEWPPHTKNFLQRGGEPESVLRVIFEHARDQDEWAGDGEHMETFGDDVEALPACRNDHEFGFVALACGIPNLGC